MSEIDAEPVDGHPTFDPPSEYRKTTLPEDLRPLVATAYGLDGEPVTVGDWIAAIYRGLEATGRGSLGFDDLCHLDGESWAFHCVFDALIAPFLDDGPAPPLTVESRLPGGDGTITAEIEAGDDGEIDVDVSPTDAVMSLGVAGSLADEPEAGFDPERAYGQVCAYGNAFPDREAYEGWAREVEDEAATVAVPFRDAVGLGRDLAVGPGTPG